MLALFDTDIRRMHRCNLTRVVLVAACCGLVISGCTAPAKYREVTSGMKSEQVLALLGKPGSIQRFRKPAPTGPYFGPKPSAEYLELPEGAEIEVWSYRYLRETWTYIFSLEGQTATIIDTGYDRPGMTY